MPGVGYRRCYVQLTALLPHIIRDTCHCRLHCGHNPFGFLDPIHTALAEAFVLRNRAHLSHLRLDLSGNARAVATHAPFQINAVVGWADVPEALGDVLVLRADALQLLARRLGLASDLLHARPCRWSVHGARRLRLVPCLLRGDLHLLESLRRLRRCVARSALLGG